MIERLSKKGVLTTITEEKFQRQKQPATSASILTGTAIKCATPMEEKVAGPMESWRTHDAIAIATV